MVENSDPKQGEDQQNPVITKAVPIKSEEAMQLTNQEFFKASMYFTDEVKLRLDGTNRFVNEFLVCNNIGRGSYSKVKRVVRLDKAQMKQLHKMQSETQSPADVEETKDDSDPEKQNPLRLANEEAEEGEENEPAEFAMKMMHKPTLKRERAIRYD